MADVECNDTRNLTGSKSWQSPRRPHLKFHIKHVLSMSRPKIIGPGIKANKLNKNSDNPCENDLSLGSTALKFITPSIKI